MSNDNLANPDQNLSKIAKDLVNEYTNNGTLHGISFIGDSKRHWFERLFWAIIFFTSMYFAANFITESYLKFQKNAIITNVDEYPTLITEIPFPAITICPTIKYDKKNYTYTEVFANKRYVDRTLDEY